MSILMLELIGLLYMLIIILLLILILLGVEHIPKEIKTFINPTSSFVLHSPLCDASHNKNIKTNIFRIQAYDSIMCGYFCIGFIDFMLVEKTLTKYTNLFSPNNFKKNDDIVLSYFMDNI